jgi:hypothetical protein
MKIDENSTTPPAIFTYTQLLLWIDELFLLSLDSWHEGLEEAESESHRCEFLGCFFKNFLKNSEEKVV